MLETWQICHDCSWTDRRLCFLCYHSPCSSVWNIIFLAWRLGWSVSSHSQLPLKHLSTLQPRPYGIFYTQLKPCLLNMLIKGFYIKHLSNVTCSIKHHSYLLCVVFFLNDSGSFYAKNLHLLKVHHYSHLPFIQIHLNCWLWLQPLLVDRVSIGVAAL